MGKNNKKHVTKTPFAVSRLGGRFLMAKFRQRRISNTLMHHPPSTALISIPRIVKRLFQKYHYLIFKKMVNHFDIQVKQNDISWPQSNRKSRVV